MTQRTPLTYPDPLGHMLAELTADKDAHILKADLQVDESFPAVEVIVPTVEIIGAHDGEGIMRHLEAAIRTAYKSEDKVGPGSAEKILKHILSLKHESTLEHHSISFRIVTSRGVTHELVRHRIASYTQESTRYVNYGKRPPQIVLPWHLVARSVEEKSFWFDSQRRIIGFYLSALSHEWKPQDARGFLPNDLKTEIVATMNLRALRNFFILRTAASAHPDMQVVAREMFRQVYAILPLLFQDIHERNQALMGEATA